MFNPVYAKIIDAIYRVEETGISILTFSKFLAVVIFLVIVFILVFLLINKATSDDRAPTEK